MASASTVTVRHGGECCSAVNCSKRRYKNPGISFFRFPKEEERCQAWVQRCRRKDLLGVDIAKLHNHVLCGDHFEDSQFMNANEKKRLIWNAVPSLFDVPNPPPPVSLKRRLPERKPVETVKKPKHKGGVQGTTTSRPPPSMQGTTTSRQKTPPLPSMQGTTTSRQKTPPPPSMEGTTTSPQKTPPPSPSNSQPKTRPRTVTTPGKFRKVVKMWQNRFYRAQGKADRKSSKNPLPTRVSVKKQKAKLISELSQFISGPSLDFIASRIDMGNKSRKHWSDKDKCLALSLLHVSPKAYELVKKIFPLPSVSTLRRAMRKVKVYPGFNENILTSLKQKVEAMSVGSELCALVFDEMTIKENVCYNVERDEVEGLEDFGTEGKTKLVANHATVFMLKGLVSGWKQPIGYFLSSGPMPGNRLHSLLLEGLDKVYEKGLNVKVLISDQGSNNRRVFETLCGVNKDKPYIDHNDKRIFVMYDPPHLLKNIRNNLKKNGFCDEGTEVGWEHIKTFFNIDKKSMFRMAPKLTYKHIHLPPFAALRVKYAVQVLSHSVAAGIATLVNVNVLPPEAAHLAKFVENFDMVFNTFNSGSSKSNQKMRHAFTQTSGHRQFLESMHSWLSALQSNSSRGVLPCLEGWLMDINALLALWDDLRANHGIKYMLTNRLNQDCLENLFSIVRGKGGHRFNPSAKEFREALRASMVDSILVQSKNSNCAEDNDKFLLTLTSFSEQAREPQLRAEDRVTDDIDIDNELTWIVANPFTEDMDPLLASTRDGVLFYISGYITKKICPKVCSGCQDLLRGSLTGANHEMFVRFKQYPGLSEGLSTPSDELFDVVQQLKRLYVWKIERCIFQQNVRATLISELSKHLDQNLLCCPRVGSEPCRLQFLVVKLFVHISFFHTLNENSRNFSQPSGKRNRKMLKLTHV